MPRSSDVRLVKITPQPARDFFTWVDRQGQPAAAPLAWCGSWLELNLPPEQWETLHLEVDGLPLPLLLSHSGKSHRIRAQWPALSAGFCQLSLFCQAELLASAEVFVGTRHLDQTQWLALLAGLRYRLPARLLLHSQHSPGGKVPVALANLPHELAEEMALIRYWLEGTPKQAGLLAALHWLARHAQRTPVMCGQWQPLCRARRPDRNQLLKSRLSPQSPVWEHGFKLGLDAPENRFVAGVVKDVRRHLSQLKAYAQHSGDTDSASMLAQSSRQLEQIWRSHPLAGLPPQSRLPNNRHALHLPAYVVSVQIKQALQQGWLPQAKGTYELPYADLALLYQHFCLLEVADALLNWGRSHGWQTDQIQLDLRRGSRVVSLSQADRCLELRTEVSYGQTGSLISLSRVQRPDLSLLLQVRGKARSLVVMDAKFRSEAGFPLKEDLDKLHAYRDAIRDRLGSTVVHQAVLLYPGANRSYLPAISAWQILPEGPPDLPIARLLADCGI